MVKSGDILRFIGSAESDDSERVALEAKISALEREKLQLQIKAQIRANKARIDFLEDVLHPIRGRSPSSTLGISLDKMPTFALRS